MANKEMCNDPTGFFFTYRFSEGLLFGGGLCAPPFSVTQWLQRPLSIADRNNYNHAVFIGGQPHDSGSLRNG